MDMNSIMKKISGAKKQQQNTDMINMAGNYS
jgi:hypothetical protein